ncbi:Nramp family divalent metal transporter [candidate division KSB1 bacterium]
MAEPERNQPTSTQDPYVRLPENVLEAPKSFFGGLRFLGPGLIITANIVGTGELIAAPTLGAQVGFYALWLIVISCMIKVLIQHELGRYTIITGNTSLRGFNGVPGPKLGVRWIVWLWAIMVLFSLFQNGAMVGGIGQALHWVVPSVPAKVWSVMSVLVCIGMLIQGTYQPIQRAVTFMVAGFSIITFICVIVLQWTPNPIDLADILKGFEFKLPGGGLVVAFATFGIVGVGATELIQYPYWCLEKGYARFTGERADDDVWLARAKGWLRVMRLDIAMAMIIYTVATIAFFLLGAHILYGNQVIPKGAEMIRTLSMMYTQSLGPWASYLFLAGAIIVLYSTLYASTAAHSRTYIDMFHIAGWISIEDSEARMRWVRRLTVILPCIAAGYFFWLGQPVLMVVIGGTAQATMLPVIGFVAIYLRYKHGEKRLQPSLIVDILLWITVCLMAAFALFNIYTRLLT